jgi:GTP diphosphokinase / guanosine-3',5'-bis(diphosphate) 3'-diphosphatase
MEISREEFLNSLKNSGLKIDIALVNKAIDFAAKYHEGQFRSSGEPYISHPIAVANIVASMKLDTASIITALLHDTVEDTDVTEEQISQEFNKEIAQLVSGVTKLTRIKFKSDQIKQAENFRKLLLAMSEDIRVLLVKIADRYHNMLTIDHLKPTKAQRIALETMEIYAPLSERIGMHKFKTELQDMSFKVLYPNVRDSILKRLNEIATDGQKNIQNIIKEIKALMKDSYIETQVFGRQKTPYSIWMKMNQKNVGFDQLSDIMAFRIIVKDLASCYQALGAIHSKYKMVPNHFHDFISTPKDNGYQSIHTIVIGPQNQRIEVQIRTADMHQVAELGVAAHWTYKQKYTAHDGKQFRWIRELLAILDHAKDPEEFISNTKLEMNYDQVFCFTPKGLLVPLPRGATTVDFAYSVHSEVGDHCAGAKVNGHLVPLRTELKNGDQVEVITNKAQVPNRDWENFVVTGRAKSEIRKFLRQQTIDQYSDLGRSLIDKAFKNHGIEFKEENLKKSLSKFGKQSLEELYACIGDGSIRREEVVKIFKPKPTLVEKIPFFNFKKTNKEPNPISIKGMIPGLALHYAGCCHPIPGDSIVGIVHTGKGITVHSAVCDYLKHLNKNDFEPIPLKWDDDEGGLYSARVVVKLGNEPGGLAVLSSELAKENCNITNFNIINRNPEIFEVLIDIEVKDKSHLNNVILSLKQKKEILDIERYKS